MNNPLFVGRKKELQELRNLDQNTGAQLIVVKGRRRIGKSRLVEEFAAQKLFLKFSGLFPEEGINANTQRENFVTQLQQQLQSPKLATDNWSDLWAYLAQTIQNKKVIILFDEISWMADGDATFLPKLKDAWDNHFKQNPNLTLVLCGSISSWIEKNILNSTGFLGRITGKINLKELQLHDMCQLLTLRNIRGSALEMLSALAITGGVPWYLELLYSKTAITTSIKKLCFSSNGILTKEFKYIFNDLFKNRSAIYKKIIACLTQKKLTQLEIANTLNYSNSAQLGEYLDDLETAGFIAKDEAWSFQTIKTKKQAQFRLKDNYLRFYLRYIEPQASRITKGYYEGEDAAEIPNFSSIIGLQFENLVLNNRSLILQALGLTKNDIAFDNPYFQKQTKKIPGCQIDYLIQTKTNTLYVCEIKFSKNAISKQIIPEMEQKISAIDKPRSFSCIPVLIHISGMSEDLENSEYFFKSIDFSHFLKPSNNHG